MMTTMMIMMMMVLWKITWVDCVRLSVQPFLPPISSNLLLLNVLPGPGLTFKWHSSDIQVLSFDLTSQPNFFTGMGTRKKNTLYVFTFIFAFQMICFCCSGPLMLGLPKYLSSHLFCSYTSQCTSWHQLSKNNSLTRWCLGFRGTSPLRAARSRPFPSLHLSSHSGSPDQWEIEGQVGYKIKGSPHLVMGIFDLYTLYWLHLI